MARLLAGADLFVHNMSPRAIEGLGLNEKDVRDISPGTIYCIVTGFGTNGPYAGRLAYDDTMQATSGLAHLQGIVTGRPEYVKSAIADQTAAIIAAYAIMAALFERERTGRVQAVEVPMFESMIDYLIAEQMGSSAFVPAYLVFPSFSGRDGALDHGELWQAGCRLGEADAPEVTRASSLRVIG